MAIADKELLFTFELDALDTRLLVVDFSGAEAISSLFEFNITLCCDDPQLDLDACIGSRAVLNIHNREHSQTVPYKGIIASMEQLGQVDDYNFYRVALVPRLWLAGLNRLNELYLNEQTIIEVISQKLQAFQGQDLRWRLKDPQIFRERSLTTQYQESDLAFVSRWLEREGIYYYFEHDGEQDGEVLVLLDHTQGQPEKTIRLRYTPPENVQTNRQDLSVTAFGRKRTQIAATALVQDFNFRNASLLDNLKAETAITAGAQGKYMLYGQNLRTEEQAQRQSQILAQELALGANVFNGTAPAIGIRCAHFLELEHHFRAELNRSYLVTAIEHRGSQSGVVLAGQNTAYNRAEQGSTYSCSFQAIDARLQYRPARKTPWPRIDGVISAVIDGQGSGKLAEINEFGQYKVQMLHDEASKAPNKGSSWLRMASPYAGKYEGMHFPLLKGAEVLLAFQQGDPDQPIILAAVPNSANQSVVRDKNRTNNSIRSVNGNYLNLSDAPGKESVAIYSPVKNTMFYIGTLPSGKGSSPPHPASDPSEILAVL